MQVILSVCAVLSLLAPDDGAAAKAMSESRNGQQTLSINEALKRASAHHPLLKQAATRIEAAKGEMQQQRLWPNPEIELESENIGGSGELSGFDGAVTTLMISQPFELGGKRSARVSAAGFERDVASAERDVLRVEIQRRVYRAFIEALIAQERLTIHGELTRIAEKFHDTVGQRAEAGKVSPLEESRARIELASARLAHTEAEREFEQKRILLAALWGDEKPDFANLAGSPYGTPDPQTFVRYESFVAGIPAFTALEASQQAREAEMRLQEALRIPDLTVSGGYKRLSNIGENAFTVGFSVSLPIFNRNQGAIAAAKVRIKGVEFQRQALRNDLLSQLRVAHSILTSAYERARSFEADILPAAEKLLANVNEGYSAGKFGYLEVLDAQRTLFEARASHLALLGEYHFGAIDLLAAVAFPEDGGLPMPTNYLTGNRHEK